MREGYDQLTDGRFEEAVATFSAAIAQEPRQAKALRGRGLAYAELKQWSLATADFAAARDADPDDAENWVDLGISLARDHQVYPAIAVFEELIAQHATHVRGLTELGFLYIRVGAISKGREFLEGALRCKPTLIERRRIEAALGEQDKLDRKRFYRPDFDALRKQRRSARSGGVTPKS